MSDTKENTGWTTPDAAPGGWNKADTERLAEYEQGYQERSEAKLAKRESTAERVEVFEERDVTDPSRVYTLREPGEVAQEREADVPELAGGGEAAGYDEVQTAEVVEEDPARAAAIAEVEQAFAGDSYGHESEAQLKAAEIEAEAVQFTGMSQATQTAEVVEEDPARAAAIAEVERAFSNPGHDQEIER